MNSTSIVSPATVTVFLTMAAQRLDAAAERGRGERDGRLVGDDGHVAVEAGLGGEDAVAQQGDRAATRHTSPISPSDMPKSARPCLTAANSSSSETPATVATRRGPSSRTIVYLMPPVSLPVFSSRSSSSTSTSGGSLERKIIPSAAGRPHRRLIAPSVSIW